MSETLSGDLKRPLGLKALEKPTISPDELHASKLLNDAGRNTIYAACNRYLRGDKNDDGIECFRIGKRIVIPTAPLRRKLGLPLVVAAVGAATFFSVGALVGAALLAV